MASPQAGKIKESTRIKIIKILLSGWKNKTEIARAYNPLLKKETRSHGTIWSWMQYWNKYLREDHDEMTVNGTKSDKKKAYYRWRTKYRLSALYFLHPFASKRKNKAENDFFAILQYLFDEDYLQEYLSKKDNPEESFKLIVISLYLTEVDSNLKKFYQKGKYHIPTITKYILEHTPKKDKFHMLLKSYRTYLEVICAEPLKLMQKRFPFIQEINSFMSFDRQIPQKYLDLFLKEHQSDKTSKK